MEKSKYDCIKGKTKLSGQYGMTLMELIIALGISTVILAAIVAFCSNSILQYKEQKQLLNSSAKTTYILQVFDRLGQYPSIRVKSDNTAVEVSNSSASPTVKIVYYEKENSIFKDTYEDSVYKNTVMIVEDYSAAFSLESNASYLKDILKVTITDPSGTTWERIISLRDCDTIETY